MDKIESNLTDRERNELAANYRLIDAIVKKTHRAVARILGWDKLYDIALDALIVAIRRHKPERGKLSTLFSWMYFREARRRAGLLQVKFDADSAYTTIGKDDALDDLPSPLDSLIASEDESRAARAFRKIKGKDREAIKDHHSGMGFREMGAKYGITAEGARQRYLTAVERFERCYLATK